MKVELIDVMGDDIRVVNAARVSFNKESGWDYVDQGGQLLPEGVYEKRLDVRDQKLISYLARHNHWTPFSHVQITMREEVPIFVARQRFKHMVGFTYNEVSRRYVDDEPEFFTPDVWRKRAEDKKQGSSDEIVDGLWEDIEKSVGPAPDYMIKDVYQHVLNEAKGLYDLMIYNGVAPEQARMVLPQSMYTSYYVTGSLAAWARAYKLRIDAHAQKEIQDLAKMWGEEIGAIDELKYSWKGLTE